MKGLAERCHEPWQRGPRTLGRELYVSTRKGRRRSPTKVYLAEVENETRSEDGRDARELAAIVIIHRCGGLGAHGSMKIVT